MPPKVDIKSESNSDSLMVLQNCRCAAGRSANSSAECDAVRPNYRSNSDPLPISEPVTADEHREKPKLARQTIRSSRSAARLIRKNVSREQEELWLLALCPAKSVLSCKLMFRGTANICVIHPRDIFRELCRVNAACFIVAHNHPSQDPNPSPEDWDVTKRLLACAEMFQIPMIDHLIVTDQNHRSMASLRPQIFSDPNWGQSQAHGTGQAGLLRQ
jgi:DNA repair protein RadC